MSWIYELRDVGHNKKYNVTLTEGYMINHEKHIEIKSGPSNQDWKFSYSDDKGSFLFRIWSDFYVVGGPLIGKCQFYLNKEDYIQIYESRTHNEIEDLIINIYDMVDNLHIHGKMNLQKITLTGVEEAFEKYKNIISIPNGGIK